jgi:hypothetical protein
MSENDSASTTPTYLTYAEAAERLGVSERWLRVEVHERAVPSENGRLLVLDLGDVDIAAVQS